MERKEMYLIATVVLFVSAAANGLVNDDFSHIVTVIFSILGAVSLALTAYYTVRVKQ